MSKYKGTVTSFKARRDDKKIMSKVLLFWENSKKFQDVNLFNSWQNIYSRKHQNLTDILDRGNINECIEYFSSFYSHDSSRGFSQGPIDKNILEQTLQQQFTKILYLFEAIHPTGYSKTEIPNVKSIKRLFSGTEDDLESILTKLKAITKVDLGIHKKYHSSGRLSYISKNRIIFKEDWEGYLISYQLRNIIKMGISLNKRLNNNVCEIGPGNALSLVYLKNFGFDKVYAFDIPTVAVIGLWNLCRIVGPDSVFAYGEKFLFDTKFLYFPHALFGNKSLSKYKIKFTSMINKASFPEMGNEIASDYFLKSQIYNCKFIYSNNYETQHKVIKLDKNEKDKFLGSASKAAEIAGWHRALRFKDWLREGFFSELFVSSD